MQKKKPHAPRTARKTRAIATRADVCRAAGVSTATVSRALNNEPGVTAAVRERVLSAARKLNYFPQAAARNLSRARTDALGLIFQDLSSGWTLGILRGISNRVCATHQILMTISTRAGDEFDLPYRMVAARHVDGLLWLDPRATPSLVRRIKQQGVPFVVLQANIADPAVNTVWIEGRSGAREAVEHLLALGYRDLMLVTGPAESPDSQDKMHGAQDALRAHGVVVPPQNVLVGNHVGTHAVQEMRAWTEVHGKLPRAIFAFNDDMAIALLTWLRKQGLRVPEDVAIVGYDGIPEAQLAGLTTVETPIYEMGCIAAQTLLDLIEDPSGEREARQISLHGRFVVRASCGAGRKSG